MHFARAQPRPGFVAVAHSFCILPSPDTQLKNYTPATHGPCTAVITSAPAAAVMQQQVQDTRAGAAGAAGAAPAMAPVITQQTQGTKEAVATAGAAGAAAVAEPVVATAAAVGARAGAPAGAVGGSRGTDVRGCQPYRWTPIGANCYYLMTRAADPGLRHEAESVLDTAAALGLNCLRTWAFNDGASQWNALQRSPGVLDERVACALDWVVSAAKARGLRLLLVLSNYWHEYGGLAQYVRWSRGLPEAAAVDAEQFYEDAAAHEAFERFTAALLTRINTCTGVAYRDEPTIMAWEVVNEPRCEARTHVPSDAMRAWLRRAIGWLRALDPHHLITIGVEGFFGPSTPGAVHANPYCQQHGADFQLDCVDVDFASCHLYPDHWLPCGTPARAVADFVARWLATHADVCRAMRKPLLLSEFGCKRSVCAHDAAGDMLSTCDSMALSRPAFYQLVLRALRTPPAAVSQGGDVGETNGPSAQLQQHSADGPGAAAAVGAMGAAHVGGASMIKSSDGKGQGGLGELAWGMQALGGGVLAGGMFWCLAAPSYGDLDGFTLLLHPSHASGTCSSESEVLAQAFVEATTMSRVRVQEGSEIGRHPESATGLIRDRKDKASAGISYCHLLSCCCVS